MFCIGHTLVEKRFVIECIDGESYCFSNVFNQQLTLHIFIIKVEGMDLLKEVWHEIFDFKFFSWISVPQAPKYSIGAFLNFLKIRGDIRELMFITGVNDTGDKLFSGVNDTGEIFIACVVDTVEQFIFPRCRWYSSEKNQKA